MKGCMSEVLRSFFSYQVAVGSTTSEYRHVVLMRKPSVTRRSSLPCGPLSCHTTSSGRRPSSAPCAPLVVPRKCLRKYSWPLPELPSRLERHTNRFLGKLSGWSGSSQLIFSLPLLSCCTT